MLQINGNPLVTCTTDPRPENMRTVSNESLRNFTVSLQHDQKTSMWESLLPLRYDNFSCDKDDIEIYNDLTSQCIQNIEKSNKEFLGSKSVGEIPDTMEKAESDQWHHQRRFRITASTVKSVVKLGENLSEHDSLQTHRTFIDKKLWGKSDNICTPDMIYGTNNEKTALRQYGEIMNATVGLSGLWVNEKYTHLAVSPDGLIFNNGQIEGVVEVKCLKILRLNTVTDIVNDMANEKILQPEVARQCFNVLDKKLILK